MISKGSAYTAQWGFVFPARWQTWLTHSSFLSNPQYRNGWGTAYKKTIRSITFKHCGKQLILKNPPNTGRLKYLLQMFPNAKFIYISRNPYHVFYSMRNIWNDTICKIYSLQSLSQRQVDEIILSYFGYLTDSYEQQKHLIPPENLIEIRYDELEKDPFNIISHIYAKVRLPAFEEQKEIF